MARKTLVQVVLLFLQAYASSRDQDKWQWYPNGKLPLIKDVKPHSEAETKVVLGCDSVQFYLATRQDPNGTTKACLNTTTLFNGKMNITKPTKILVHGWENSRLTSFTQSVTKAYLEVEDVNVIQVDWSKDAKTDYFTASYRVPQVGYTLSKFINELLRELKMEVTNLQMIGFSLGAHVVGIAGYYTTPKLPLVVGLDPAGPLFEWNGPTGKITKESGKFVVVLHCCKYRLGTYENSGHLNFNANSGISQPGCGDVKNELESSCSHKRAPELYVASMTYPRGFLATKCTKYWEYKLGLCNCEPTTYFNPNFNNSLSGIYYFETTSTYPFIKSNDSTTTKGQTEEKNTSPTAAPDEKRSRTEKHEEGYLPSTPQMNPKLRNLARK